MRAQCAPPPEPLGLNCILRILNSQAKNDLRQISKSDSSTHLVRRDTERRKKFRKVSIKKNQNKVKNKNDKRSRQSNNKREKQTKRCRNKTNKRKNSGYGKRTKPALAGLRKKTGVEMEMKFSGKYLLDPLFAK